MNLPEDYQNKMQKMLGGDEYLQYLDSFNYSYGLPSWRSTKIKYLISWFYW